MAGEFLNSVKKGTTALSDEEQQKEQAQRLKDQVEQSGGAIVTPLESSVIGQTPDQAKMAGTPAQKLSTLEQAAAQSERLKVLPQEETLAGYQRLQSFEGTADDAAIQSAKEFSAKMKEFGSLGSGVESKVRSMLEGTVGKYGKANIEIIDERIKDLGDADEIKTVLVEFKRLIEAGKQPEAAEYLASKQLLFDSADENINVIDIIKETFGETEASQQAAVASMIADGILDPGEMKLSDVLGTVDPTFVSKYAASGGVGMEDVPLDLFGGLTVTDMVTMIGPEWYNMPVDKIADVLDSKRDEILGNVSKIQSQLSDPNLSPAIRESLMDQLRMYSATGIVQEEMEAQETIDKINNSGKVKWGDTVYDLEQLLDNDRIKGEIVDFLTMSDEDRKKLIANNPDKEDFYGWIQKEFEGAATAGKSITDAVNSFKELQESNSTAIENNITSIKGFEKLTPLDLEMMKELGIDPESWSGEEVKIKDIPLISAITSGKYNRDITERINGLPKELKAELAAIKDTEKLEAALNFLNGEQYNNAVKFKDTVDELKSARTNDDIFKSLFGTTKNFTDYNSFLNYKKDLENRAKFGDIGAKNKLAEINNLLPITNGKIDINKLIGNLDDFSLAGMIAGEGQLDKFTNDIVSITNPVSSTLDAFTEKVMESWGMNQSIESLVAYGSGNTMEDVTNLDKLYEMVKKGYLKDPKNLIKKAKIKKYSEVTDALINKKVKGFDEIDSESDRTKAFGAEYEIEKLIKETKHPEIKRKLEKKLKDLRKRTDYMKMGWSNVVSTSKHFTKNVKGTLAEMVAYYGTGDTSVFYRDSYGDYRLRPIKENKGSALGAKIQNVIGRRWTMDRKNDYRKSKGWPRVGMQEVTDWKELPAEKYKRDYREITGDRDPRGTKQKERYRGDINTSDNGEKYA